MSGYNTMMKNAKIYTLNLTKYVKASINHVNNLNYSNGNMIS